MNTHSNTLHSHRKAAGLRQHEVARALGLNGSERISKWENGYSVPREKTLFRLAGLYHVPPQQLFREVYGTTPLEHIPQPFTMVPSQDPDGTGPFWKKDRHNRPISELSLPSAVDTQEEV
jgi:transcriptional regulator with XRE-family HTH domain